MLDIVKHPYPNVLNLLNPLKSYKPFSPHEKNNTKLQKIIHISLNKAKTRRIKDKRRDKRNKSTIKANIITNSNRNITFKKKFS